MGNIQNYSFLQGDWRYLPEDKNENNQAIS
jgi:hypothetical protein